MSWGRLPRPNPCVPCMVANPKRRKNSGDVHVHVDMPRAHAASGRGRTVERNANPSNIDAQIDFEYGLKVGDDVILVSKSGDEASATIDRIVDGKWGIGRMYWLSSPLLPAGEVLRLPGSNSYGVKSVRLAPGDGERHGSTESMRAIAARVNRPHPSGPKWRAIDSTPEQDNPKLMVLNPSTGLEGAIERKLRRRLTSKEKSLLAAACREFKTFHGREAKAEDLVPVDVPPGTPMFVMGIGKVERQNYTVPMESERRGKWTHKAGDHGGKHETKAPWFASIPGRSKHNVVIAQPPGAKTYFKPTHGLMG